MDRRGRCRALSAGLLMALAFAIWASPEGTSAYQNFSVGDDKGWTYPTANVVDYQKWAQGKNFTLGDFLLFSYPQEEHDVVVTYNETVFKACDYESSTDNDYDVWGQAGNSTYSAVPLVRTGMTYFFCSVNSGEHCKGGMKFSINVTQGEGLPASLMFPSSAPFDSGGGGGGDGGGDGGGGGGGGGSGGDGGSSYDSPTVGDSNLATHTLILGSMSFLLVLASLMV